MSGRSKKSFLAESYLEEISFEISHLHARHLNVHEKCVKVFSERIRSNSNAITNNLFLQVGLH